MLGPTHSVHQAFRPASTPFPPPCPSANAKEFSHVARADLRKDAPTPRTAQRCGCTHVIDSTRARLRNVPKQRPSWRRVLCLDHPATPTPRRQPRNTPCRAATRGPVGHFFTSAVRLRPPRTQTAPPLPALLAEVSVDDANVPVVTAKPKRRKKGFVAAPELESELVSSGGRAGGRPYVTVYLRAGG
jgi:hypothetical protein